MDVTLTITYTAEEVGDGSAFPTVNDPIAALLENTLPYMVGNFDFHFTIADEAVPH